MHVSLQDGSLQSDWMREYKLPRVKSGFTARSVQRNGWQYLYTNDDVTAALELLIDSNWLVAEEKKSLGRPTTVYIINPKTNGVKV